MTDSRPQTEALTVLRALFDLVDADVEPTLDLLERLLGLGSGEAAAYVALLRGRKLVQAGALRPTFAGLALALNVAETEPVAARARVETRAA